MENFPGTPSYASGTLEFRREEPRGAAATADGGSSAADGGQPALEAADTGEDHVDHASYWPVLIALFSFATLIGFSGLETGSFVEGPEGLVYAATAVVGSVGVLGAVAAMGAENFTAHEGGFGEAWPFDGVENTKLGMWVFLASDVVLFGGFIGSAIFLRVAFGWNQWEPIPHNPIPGLINTYLLLTSSFTVILALVAAEKGSRKGVVAGLGATFLLGLGFLGNKAIEWVELFSEGTGLDASIRASTYYLTTGLHMGHVIAGLLITAYLIWRAWNGAYTDGNDEPLEYFGLYWHFVDIVWLFLFPLFYIV
jgi:cytochrome c oxidase subunit I+III